MTIKCKCCGADKPYDLVGDARAEQMYNLKYEQGFTLEDIGQIFNITKQRAHQIIKRYVKNNR